MKNTIILITSLIVAVSVAAQDSLILGWNDTVSNQQRISNPTYVAYPKSLATDIPIMKCDSEAPSGFSISPTRKVFFSPGNLQYKASTNTWRFADHQWDYVGGGSVLSGGNVHDGGIGCNNDWISNNYACWIDLFGWATSGYNSTPPYLTSFNSQDYGPNDTPVVNDYDWGNYNMPPWRTLKRDEWEYILRGRENAATLWCLAKVHGVNGIILFPDNWSNMFNIPVTPHNPNYYENTISNDNWAMLEFEGAVFLPDAGQRRVVPNYYGVDEMKYGGWFAAYWSFSLYDSQNAWIFSFNEFYTEADADNNIKTRYVERRNGCSVRLVQDM